MGGIEKAGYIGEKGVKGEEGVGRSEGGKVLLLFAIISAFEN